METFYKQKEQDQGQNIFVDDYVHNECVVLDTVEAPSFFDALLKFIEKESNPRNIPVVLKRVSNNSSIYHISHQWAECVDAIKKPIHSIHLYLWPNESLEEECLLFSGLGLDNYQQDRMTELENTCKKCSRTLLIKLRTLGIKRFYEVSL